MGLTNDYAGRTELTWAILNKDAARQNAMYLVPGPIAENMKTYPKRNAPEEGV
ncbi:hypothetical protein AALA80_05855 [Oscillospiraceae bacterium 50-60]